MALSDIGHAPIVGPVPVVAKIPDYDPHPQYSFAYNVHDSLTGDAKTQQETRNGDVVHGSYSVIDADGSHRVVEYTADPIHGFNAVVHREPLAVKGVVPVAPAVPAHFARVRPHLLAPHLHVH